MEWSPILALLLLQVSVSTALEWTPTSLPDNGTLYACVGSDVSLTWNFTVSPDQRLRDVTWYRQTKGRQKQTLAVRSLGDFMVVNGETKNVTFHPEDGVTLHDVTDADSGVYTIETTFTEGDCIKSDTRDVNLRVAGTCAMMIDVDTRLTNLESHVAQQVGGDQGQLDELSSGLTQVNDSVGQLAQQLTQDISQLSQQMTSLITIIHTIAPIQACTMKGGTVFDNVCYLHVNEKKTWSEANATCEALSGHLVEVLSEQVNNFLVTLVDSGGFVEQDSFIWLGLTDLQEEGSFVWTSS